MRLLICGDRNWSDQVRLNSFLDDLLTKLNIELVIEGEARGADTMGRLWAEIHSIPVEPHPADWAKYGRAAGPIRNSEMLKSNPDLVIAFHNFLSASKGTANMVKASIKAGIPVVHVTIHSVQSLPLQKEITNSKEKI